MEKNISTRRTRVRFAPSPTGPLHMGGVRTALYNYLFAKKAGGDFIIRIEDTDSQRFVKDAEQYIIDSLKWCGIYPDEGVDQNGNIVEIASERHPHAPYRQSQRKAIYRKYAEQLVANGNAYYAFDSSEELEARRKEAEANKGTFTYNYISRLELKNSLTLSKEESQNLINTTNNWTIRFKNPVDSIVKMDDLIRGHIEVNTNTLDDKVLWKAIDELPTYHLANIVDDHLMEITEVIRGEEWLPSLPLHYLLYQAFGWQDSQPNFAHLSLLLKPDGKGKLSKRDGDRLGFPVFPLKWVNEQGEVSRAYREDGYYPQAFVNMLALLGWNPGTEQEIFSIEELTQAFSLDRVIKSGAKFNPDKAKWFNKEYLLARSNALLVEDFEPILKEKGINIPDKNYLELVCALIKERAHFVNEFWDICSYFFVAPTSYASADVQKFYTQDTAVIMESVLAHIEQMDISDYNSISKAMPNSSIKELEEAKATAMHHIEEELSSYIKENEWKMGTVMNTLRLMFVGASKGLGIADIIFFIGKDEAINRIKRFAK